MLLSSLPDELVGEPEGESSGAVSLPVGDGAPLEAGAVVVPFWGFSVWLGSTRPLSSPGLVVSASSDSSLYSARVWPFGLFCGLV